MSLVVAGAAPPSPSHQNEEIEERDNTVADKIDGNENSQVHNNTAPVVDTNENHEGHDDDPGTSVDDASDAPWTGGEGAGVTTAAESCASTTSRQELGGVEDNTEALSLSPFMPEGGIEPDSEINKVNNTVQETSRPPYITGGEGAESVAASDSAGDADGNVPGVEDDGSALNPEAKSVGAPVAVIQQAEEHLSCKYTKDELMWRHWGVSVEQMKRVKALLRLGVSEDDLVIAKKLVNLGWCVLKHHKSRCTIVSSPL